MKTKKITIQAINLTNDEQINVDSEREREKAYIFLERKRRTGGLLHTEPEKKNRSYMKKKLYEIEI